MVFTRFHDPKLFVDKVNPFLMATEAESNLMIGIAGSLAAQETPPPFLIDQSGLLSCVTDGSQVSGAAVMTPPHNLVLTRAPEPAIRLFAESIYRAGLTPPGLLSPTGTAELFAAEWRRLTGQQFELAKSMRAFQLTQVTPVHGVSGRARTATPDDADLVANWLAAFAVDTHTLPEPPEKAMQFIESEKLMLWTDPEPVAMALAGGVTPNGRRVGGVYTPPAHRCHGYASAVVAQVSQNILDSGKKFCFLFTDLANPTSNSIYAKMGYKPVSDFAEYRFTAHG